MARCGEGDGLENRRHVRRRGRGCVRTWLTPQQHLLLHRYQVGQHTDRYQGQDNQDGNQNSGPTDKA